MPHAEAPELPRTGAAIREWRRQLRVSQQRLAQELESNRSAVSKTSFATLRGSPTGWKSFHQSRAAASPVSHLFRTINSLSRGVPSNDPLMTHSGRPENPYL